MRKNEYTEKIDEIKAPQSAVENAVKAALEADKNRKEVIAMPKKSKIIKIVSAAAACVLVVTGVAVASNMNSPKPIIHDNSAPSQIETSVTKSFSLIVNAAELTEENAVGISELNMSGLNAMGTDCMYIEKVDIDENTSKLRAAWYPTMGFPVVCKGNGIESLTYKINNAMFVINENLNFSSITRTESMIERYDEYVCNSFTIEYDEQLKSNYPAHIQLKSSDSPDLAKDDLTRQAQKFLENMPDFDAFVDFKNGDKYPELRNALFKAAIEDVTVDITVNYTDGTNATYTIAFIGKYDEIDKGTMPVEVTFVSELSPEEKAVVKGSSEYQPKDRLTLEKTKEIISDALAQVEDKSNLSNYLVTVTEYIKSKVNEIQPVPNFIPPDSDVYVYYYCLDSDEFEDCHKAIVWYGSNIVYEEYDDNHNVINSEVLYDSSTYIKNLR